MTLHKNRRHSAHISGWKQIFLHKNCKKAPVWMTMLLRAVSSSLPETTLNHFNRMILGSSKIPRDFPPVKWRADDGRRQVISHPAGSRIWGLLQEHPWYPKGSVLLLFTLLWLQTCTAQVSQAPGENPKEVKAQGRNYCMAVFKIICSVTICVQVLCNVFIMV